MNAGPLPCNVDNQKNEQNERSAAVCAPPFQTSLTIERLFDPLRQAAPK